MDIVVIGAGYAGLACALRLMRRGRRHGARVRLINPVQNFNERIRLHQAAAGQGLRQRPLRPLLRRAGVEFVHGQVERIDLQSRRVWVDGQWLRWDRLVIATGSRIRPPPLPGLSSFTVPLSPWIVGELSARLSGLIDADRVLVVGGGLTGIETAAEIAEAHPRLTVTLLSRGAPMPDWSSSGRDSLLRGLDRLGVRVELGVDVVGASEGLLHTDRGDLPFALCLWTAGFVMPTLAADAGLAVDDGRVLVDPQLRSISHPQVYVAGDATRPVLAPGDPLPMGCKSAMPTGIQVAENLLRELRGLAPAAFDFATPFYCLSLGRRRGLIQFPDRHGACSGAILDGRPGAWFKELVCKSTWWALWAESYGLPATLWRRTGRAPDAAARETAGHA